MDVLFYFRAEVDTVGRHWRDLLEEFDEYTAKRRPTPDTNHALWLTGHMAWAEDYLINEVPIGKSLRRKEWDRLFDHSSEKLADDQYPPLLEVRAQYVQIHSEVLKFMVGLSDKDLAKASAIERRWFPTAGHAIAHQVTHGHYHLGQLTYLAKLREAKKL